MAIISSCASRVKKTRARLKKKGLSEAVLCERDGTLQEAIDKAVKKEFARRDQVRVRAEATMRTYNAREQERIAEERDYWRNVKASEVEWREGRAERAKKWQGFARGKKRKGKSSILNDAEKRRKDALKSTKGMGIDESYKASWR